MTTAQIILNQLGKGFSFITGSKNFVDYGNGLRMNLSRNKSKAKYLMITLDKKTDTYTMDFFNCDKEFNLISKAKFDNIYTEQLQEIFTEVTGLTTKMPVIHFV